MMAAINTLSYLVQHVRNWPLFLGDAALTGLIHTRRLLTYRFRDGTQLAVRPFTTDKWVLTDIWRRDPYWHPKFRLSNQPTFLDIGAHIGGWTVYMARRFPTARVVACEPVPENFALLRENIRRNQLTRVTALKAALAPQSGTVQLFFDPTHSAYSGQKPRPRHQQGSPRRVRAITLAECLQQAKTSHIDLVKCDIEGAEFSLLPSLPADVLRRITNISLEYHLFQKDCRVELLIDFLKDHGFELLDHVPTLADSGYAKFRLK